MILRCPCGGTVGCNGLFGGEMTIPPSPKAFEPRSVRCIGASQGDDENVPRRYPLEIPWRRATASTSPKTTYSDLSSRRRSLSPFEESAERFAIHLRARRTRWPSMVLLRPCGGTVRCNGLFGGILTAYPVPKPRIHTPARSRRLPPVEESPWYPSTI